VFPSLLDSVRATLYVAWSLLVQCDHFRAFSSKIVCLQKKGEDTMNCCSSMGVRGWWRKRTETRVICFCWESEGYWAIYAQLILFHVFLVVGTTHPSTFFFFMFLARNRSHGLSPSVNCKHMILLERAVVS
jgi:hypothetical protein